MELQIIGPSLQEIQEALGVRDELRAGAPIALTDTATMTVEDVSKSSGFDATTVILTAIVTIATTTTTEVLTEWLKSRLVKRGQKPTVTIVVDGKEIRVS
jgi:hypothetical protein